jgi:transposase
MWGIPETAQIRFKAGKRRPTLNRDRFVLTDAHWERVAPILPGKVGDPGRSAADNRLFLEGVLFVVRTGIQWRDIDAGFGKWNSLYKRFRRWTLKGVFEKIFNALSDDPDFEYVMIDGTIVRVHQHGTGAKGGLKMRRLVVQKVA